MLTIFWSNKVAVCSQTNFSVLLLKYLYYIIIINVYMMISQNATCLIAWPDPIKSWNFKFTRHLYLVSCFGVSCNNWAIFNKKLFSFYLLHLKCALASCHIFLVKFGINYLISKIVFIRISNLLWNWNFFCNWILPYARFAVSFRHITNVEICHLCIVFLISNCILLHTL